jgi:hypothetical protein
MCDIAYAPHHPLSSRERDRSDEEAETLGLFTGISIAAPAIA